MRGAARRADGEALPVADGRAVAPAAPAPAQELRPRKMPRSLMLLGAAGAAGAFVGLRPARASAASSVVLTAPDNAADNTIRPTADVVALTIRGQSGGQQSDLVEIFTGPAEGSGLFISAHKHAISASHDTDWAGEAWDLIDLFHKSTGDAVFIVHQGGEPPGFSGEAGGDAGLNVLIPYNIDGTGTGWDGSTRNDRTGMRGLFIQSQPTNDNVHAALIDHYGNDYGVKITAQNPGHPAGTGGALKLSDYSGSSSLYIEKRGQPGATDAALQIRGLAGAPVAALRVVDDDGRQNVLIKTDGTIRALAASQSFRGHELYMDNNFTTRVGRVMTAAHPGGGWCLGLIGESGRPILVRGGDAGSTALMIAAHPAQTGRLIELRDATNQLLQTTDGVGATRWYAPGNNPTLVADGATGWFRGGFISKKTAPAADSQLANGEFSISLDATPGTAKVVFKAKDANGTVRTATIALK